MGPPASQPKELSPRSRQELFRHYNRAGTRLYMPTDVFAPTNGPFFSPKARFYKHFVLDNRRITPTTTSLKTSASSALVKAMVHGQMHVGEVMTVFRHGQNEPGDECTFVEVRWLIREALSPVEGDPWADL